MKSSTWVPLVLRNHFKSSFLRPHARCARRAGTMAGVAVAEWSISFRDLFQRPHGSGHHEGRGLGHRTPTLTVLRIQRTKSETTTTATISPPRGRGKALGPHGSLVDGGSHFSVPHLAQEKGQSRLALSGRPLWHIPGVCNYWEMRGPFFFPCYPLPPPFVFLPGMELSTLAVQKTFHSHDRSRAVVLAHRRLFSYREIQAINHNK